MAFTLGSGEKLYGAMTSLVSGSISSGLMLAGVKFGLSTEMSVLLFIYVFGSLLGYSLDIVFAKQELPVGIQNALVKVPYRDLGVRAMYLLRSIIDRKFYKFILIVILDTLVGLALLRAARQYLDNHGILKNFKYRDAFVALLVVIFTFILFVNTLRFDWAYHDSTNITTDMVILMWLTMTLLLFAITYVFFDSKNQ